MNWTFEKFCGGTFWNSSLTWYTTDPSFTECFLWTAVAWTPCLYLLLLSPFYLFCYLVHLKPPKFAIRGISFLFVWKCILSTSLIATSLGYLVYCGALYSTGGSPMVALVSASMMILTFMVSAIVMKIEHQKKLVTSEFHFIFYLLLVIACAILGYSLVRWIVDQSNSETMDTWRVAAYTFCYAVFAVQIFVMFVLFCFTDHVAVELLEKTCPEICPEKTSSFLNKLIFFWVTSFILKGYRKALTICDLWNPLDGQYATSNRKAFLKLWNKKRSVLLVLFRMFGRRFLMAQLSSLSFIIGMFGIPFVLSIFIEFFDDGNEEQWKGYLYCIQFLISYILHTISWNQASYWSEDVGLRVKSTLTAVVAQKLLCLNVMAVNGNRLPNFDKLTISNKLITEKSCGEAVTLISTDVHNLGEIAVNLHYVWSIPLQTVLVLGVLWWCLGFSTLAVVALLTLVLVIILITSHYLNFFQLAFLRETDGRIKLLSEVINGIKLIKMYTWENLFSDKMMKLRKKELSILKKILSVNSINLFCSIFVENLIIYVTFSVYSWFIGPLTAKKAFTSFCVFKVLQYQFQSTPIIMTQLVKAKTSLERVESYLHLPELKNYVTKHIETTALKEKVLIAEPIEIENGSFTWNSSVKPTLQNINLKVTGGSFTAVVGLVGSGKSSVLLAILGEMTRLEGQVSVKGRTAYMSQQSWILNATFRDNILLGQPYCDAKYSRILEACALTHDVDNLPAGDLTMIEEKGTNLSGGQKQRVSLARSLYQDCDVYLLDDPLSAVDSHVAKHIFNNVIGREGLLKNKTRLLVTHAINFLPETDTIIVVDDGKIEQHGTYEDLSQNGGMFEKVLENIKNQLASDSGISGTVIEKQISNISTLCNRKPHKNRDFDYESVDSPSIDLNPEVIGSVKKSTYNLYMSKIGYASCIFIIFFFIAFKTFSVTSLIWISYWTNDTKLKNSYFKTDNPGKTVNDSRNVNHTFESADGRGYYSYQQYYILTYLYFLIGHGVCLFAYCILSIFSYIRASRSFYSKLLSTIMEAPISFFEKTSAGRILNRFSRDLSALDSNTPDLTHQWLTAFTSLCASAVIVSLSLPLFLAVALGIVIVFIGLQHLYLPTVRQLKWEECRSRSPIYALVCEMRTGLSTIRAFERQSLFNEKLESLIDNNTVFSFAIMAAERWLGCQLGFAGAAATFAAALFSVFNRASLDGSVVGMYMALSVHDSFALYHMVRLNSAMETNMVSIERLKEYMFMEVETDKDENVDSSNEASVDWSLPKLTMGKIEFKNYSMKYRPDINYSLKNINFKINSGEKIAIVGRTGAGKSSLISALFRFAQSNIGSICIDDLDISKLPLKHLRSNITVLPQDPIIFNGSIRMNLDPLSFHTDREIWDALIKVRMAELIRSLPGSLSYVCQVEGLNFSTGQRQLLCLGRTLLHKTAILILDEATAGVDLETGRIVQETIRNEFAKCTVLTIAHRIDTVLNCDRILFLDAGKVKEIHS